MVNGIAQWRQVMNSVHESVIEIFIRGIRGSILFLPFFQEPLVFDQDFDYALFLFFFRSRQRAASGSARFDPAAAAEC